MLQSPPLTKQDIAALTPIIEKGARQCAQHSADRAVAQAKANRAARGVAK